MSAPAKKAVMTNEKPLPSENTNIAGKVKTGSWEQRLQQRKRLAEVKQREREMAQEKEDEAQRKREVRRERERKAQEKARLEEMASKVRYQSNIR